MSTPLRGDEIQACLHRIALRRGSPQVINAVSPDDEQVHRHNQADEHRRRVLDTWRESYDVVEPMNESETLLALHRGELLILNPRLPDDVEHQRRARVPALWRLGRHGDHFIYAPMVVKNHEVIEPATTRRLLESPLRNLSPVDALLREGVGPRSNPSVTRSGITLAHATRLLQHLGHGDLRGRSAIVDRSSRVWWFDLANTDLPRFNLDLYDREWALRFDLLRAHQAWREGVGDFPTSPYWHKECETCPYRNHCRDELESRDDVSLTRYTSLEQQRQLRLFDVHTRRDLAALDPHLITTRSETNSPSRETQLGVTIERLADLIYRARATTTGSPLRILDAEQVACPTADVEVDIDMESYDDRTYLWGATVRTRVDLAGVEEGARSFVTWERLTDESEAEVFTSFWTWFQQLREHTLREGRSFAAYCFWARAEDGAIDRALAHVNDGGATHAEVEQFRSARPAQWIDLHECAKRCIQTDGPLGLKPLARAAGFTWRDENPSGEASMRWYEIATGEGDDAFASRQRILDYNEDDCRATAALRDWLNGPARRLPHRDDQ